MAMLLDGQKTKLTVRRITSRQPLWLWQPDEVRRAKIKVVGAAEIAIVVTVVVVVLLPL